MWWKRSFLSGIQVNEDAIWKRAWGVTDNVIVDWRENEIWYIQRQQSGRQMSDWPAHNQTTVTCQFTESSVDVVAPVQQVEYACVFSQLSWERVGGCPGLCIAVHQETQPSIYFHGSCWCTQHLVRRPTCQMNDFVHHFALTLLNKTRQRGSISVAHSKKKFICVKCGHARLTDIRT